MWGHDPLDRRLALQPRCRPRNAERPTRRTRATAGPSMHPCIHRTNQPPRSLPRPARADGHGAQISERERAQPGTARKGSPPLTPPRSNPFRLHPCLPQPETPPHRTPLSSRSGGRSREERRASRGELYYTVVRDDSAVNFGKLVTTWKLQ
ncbi:hypothetical protein ZWY2020_022398 [Hordeum vulgare]|nr:hypothetical protein ZWY2020_022398 [Hordeum vulgare]